MIGPVFIGANVGCAHQVRPPGPEGAAPARARPPCVGALVRRRRDPHTMEGMPKDLNAELSATLRELASAQTVTFKARVFRRAAAAVLALDRPIDQLLGPQG